MEIKKFRKPLKYVYKKHVVFDKQKQTINVRDPWACLLLRSNILNAFMSCRGMFSTSTNFKKLQIFANNFLWFTLNISSRFIFSSFFRLKCTVLFIPLNDKNPQHPLKSFHSSLCHYFLSLNVFVKILFI